MNKVFTEEEVAVHNQKDDCWTIIHGKVYDVTHYLNDHPGGINIILKKAGKDSTEDFEALYHSPKARAMLVPMCVGILKSAVGRNSKGGPNRGGANFLGLPPGTRGFGPRQALPNRSPVPRVPTFNAPAASLRLPSNGSGKLPVQQSPVASGSMPPPSMSMKSMRCSVVSTTTESHDTVRIVVEPGVVVPPGGHISILRRKEPNSAHIKRPYTPISSSDRSMELLIKVGD